MNTKWLKISLGYFFIIAILGTLMRFSFFTDLLPINYKHILHTHSHIGFLGWVYPVLFISLTNKYLKKEQIINGKYNLQFIITQFILAGMLISFLFQGYGLVSIILSTIFQFLTYWFTFQFFKDWQNNTEFHRTYGYSIKFIKAGLISLVFSSLGTWSLAVIGAKGLAGTYLHDLAIYFYLHFQYNGWFAFSILGLLISILETNKLNFSKKYTDYSYKLLAFSLYPSYLLSILGKIQNPLITFIGSLSGIIQLIGAIYFLMIIFNLTKQLNQLFSNYLKPLIAISLASFLGKNILQLISALPLLNNFVFDNRYLVIAYLHMIFLGFVSFFFFVYLSYTGCYSLKSKLAKIGVIFLISGFSVSELLLVIPSLNILIPNLSFLIFLFSALMATGLACFIFAQFNFRSKKLIQSNSLILKNRYAESLK